MKAKSIWIDNLDYTPNKKLDKDIEVDVLIIGGGITGLSVAYHLINSNLKVCLVERNLIAHGVTSRTTAKLTYLQELIYTDLKQEYDEETSKLYLSSQKDAIKMVKKIVDTHNIDCDFEVVPSFVFTKDKYKINDIKEEKELLKKFKINVNDHYTLPDEESVNYAISVIDTAVFNPVKYLIKIKEICEKNKIEIYENTKIIKIDKGSKYICKTENTTIKAKKVVLAMHYPYFLFPFLMPLKTHLEKSYIAVYEDKNKHFSAITPSNPTTSIRYIKKDNKTYKLTLSNSHNIAFNNNDSKNFHELLNKIDKTPKYIWSNKDIITNDKLPYIGELEKDMYMATGYNTWGMTNGSMAGKIISDLIQNKQNKYKELFNPKRHLGLLNIINSPINITSNAYSFTSSKINKNKSWYNQDIIFKKKNGKDIAIYIDENNKKHIVYNQCPHLKCSLIFNEKEKTWDCPCHGSRFDIDGKCIEGPSNYDISYNE